MSESAERIYALLVDANPVPDIDAVSTHPADRPHLHVIDTRSDEMQTQTRPERTQQEPAEPRRRMWIPAAAAVLVLAALGVGAWLFGGTDTTVPPATEAPVPTTAVQVPTTEASVPTTAVSEASPVETDEARIAVAQALIADWSAGDVDAFFSHFSEDGGIQGNAVTDASLRRDLAFYMALRQVPVVSECRPTTGTTIQCDSVMSDDLTGSIGAEIGMDWLIRVEGGAVTNLGWAFAPADLDPFIFIEDMPAWIAENHTDVFDEVFRATMERCDATNVNFYGTWCASAAAAEEMLRLGPEYLASLGY